MKLLAAAGLCFLVASSFSKSFSLYGERVGSLHVVVATSTAATLFLVAEPLLYAWTGDRALAAQAAPTLGLYALGNGLLAVSHNTLAVVGLAVISAGFILGERADVRSMLEERTLSWLQDRQDERLADGDDGSLLDFGDVSVGDRAPATDPSELNRQQASVAPAGQ